MTGFELATTTPPPLSALAHDSGLQPAAIGLGCTTQKKSKLHRTSPQLTTRHSCICKPSSQMSNKAKLWISCGLVSFFFRTLNLWVESEIYHYFPALSLHQSWGGLTAARKASTPYKPEQAPSSSEDTPHAPSQAHFQGETGPVPCTASKLLASRALAFLTHPLLLALETSQWSETGREYIGS